MHLPTDSCANPAWPLVLLQARMEAEAATASAADLQQRLGELQAATKVSGEDAARLKALGAEIGKDEKALAELKRKSEGLSQRAEALQAQIEGAGGEKLRRQRALCDKLQEVRGHTCFGGARGLGLCPGAVVSLHWQAQ